jgi:O-antigen ligase
MVCSHAFGGSVVTSLQDARSSADLVSTDTSESGGPWRLVYLGLIAWIVLNRAIPDGFVLPVGVDIHPSQAVLLMTIMALAVALIREPLPWPKGIPALAGMAMALVIVLAPFIASPTHNAYEADGAERGLFLLVIYIGLFLAAYFVSHWDRRARGLLSAVVIMTTWQALLTILESRMSAASAIAWPIWGFLGLEPAAVARGEQFRPSGLFRPQGTSPHPIVASALVAICVLIVVAIILDENQRSRRRWLFASLAPLAISLLVVNTRTGFVILLAGTLVVIALQARRLPRLIPLAIAGMIAMGFAVVLAPSGLRATLDLFWNAGKDSSVNVRVDRLSAVPDLIAENPILGAGWLTNDPHVHLFDNTWILTLVELGIVGTAVVLVFLVASFVRMSSMRGYATPIEMTLILSGTFAASALIVSGLTFDVLAFDQFLPTCVLLLGMGLAGADRAARRRERDERSLHPE